MHSESPTFCNVRNQWRNLTDNKEEHGVEWIGLSNVLRPRQHSIGYMGDSFYRSKDPTNSIKVRKNTTKENLENANNIIHT